jgi:1-hydroxycarotenoid 3,4-desaturase
MPTSGPTAQGPGETGVVIIGAGVAGLCAAVLLAAKGLRVTVLERAAAPGGKLREVIAGGRPIDAGPTVMTLPDVFEQVFDAAGARLSDHLTLTPMAVLARHGWSNGARLDLFADAEASADAIGRFAGTQEADGFRRFRKRALTYRRLLDESFMRAERPNILQLSARLGPFGLLKLSGRDSFTTLWSTLGTYFKDQRLRQLFGRYATYCGSSPFAAPALLMLIAEVEQDGVWIVEGGMHRIARALETVAKQQGATFHYSADVSEIIVRSGAARGVRLRGGEEIAADAVISAGDAGALAAGLFGAAAKPAVPRPDPALRSLSAVTWNMTTETSGFPLIRHNVFFSDNYPAEFENIRSGRLPRQPTVYVCAQDRGDDGATQPQEAERLLVLVNAPATGESRPQSQEEIAACQASAFTLMQQAGLSIAPCPEATVTTTPREFAALFPATEGAIYGQATHGWFASFKRPGSRSALPGLYLAGGSVHPGAGLPMAALSAIRCADSLLQDFASMRRSRPAVTVGGISTA